MSSIHKTRPIVKNLNAINFIDSSKQVNISPGVIVVVVIGWSVVGISTPEVQKKKKSLLKEIIADVASQPGMTVSVAGREKIKSGGLPKKTATHTTTVPLYSGMAVMFN